MVDRAAVEEIRRAVRETGREITVVAAAKTRTKEEIDELMRLAPEFVLGENRVQEFMSAYDPAYRWHFIGQLQTNKVKYLAGKVELIHSLDRHELAREIERRSERAGVVQDCLVEVNMGSEISKGGVHTRACRISAHTRARVDERASRPRGYPRAQRALRRSRGALRRGEKTPRSGR